MSDVWQTRTVTREVREWVGAVCDWCGSDEPYLIPINLSINRGEEMGATWTKHACDSCFLEHVARHLLDAGFVGGLLGADDSKHIVPDEDEE